MKLLSAVPLVLASSSPRRSELLTTAGAAFDVVKPQIEEKRKRGESPEKFVKRLSVEKAQAVAGEAIQLKGRALIIAADTIVISPDKKLLGKPQDEKDAVRMLKKLMGKTHAVLTGYTILEVNHTREYRKTSRVVTSKVKIKKLNRDEIKAYVATGEPMDKAGAYAAQGYGMTFIEGISGSYTNVVGLPLSQLLQDLEKHFQVRYVG